MTKMTKTQNYIILGILDEFRETYSFTKKEYTDSKVFEYLAAYTIGGRIDPESFRDPLVFQEIDVDKKKEGSASNEGTYGIDSFALFVNDKLVKNVDDLEFHRKSGRLDTQFVFIQSKFSDSFDTGDFLKFIDAAKRFFTQDVSDSDSLAEKKDLFSQIIRHKYTRLWKSKRPTCSLFFVTSGSKTKISNKSVLDTLRIAREDLKERLANIMMFEDITVEHVGAEDLVRAYNESSGTYRAQIRFQSRLNCGDIKDVYQSWIGFLSISEFLKLIVGEDGKIRSNIFYENVRDFQGFDNKVNQEILETLNEESMIDKFLLLNNGVTIIARELRPLVSDDFEISDYYIVNGCQTSNAIYSCRDNISQRSDLKIPVKIVHTDSDDLIGQLVKATNRQTPVPDEAFCALEKFHKRLFEYYKHYSRIEHTENLYYERRSKELQHTDAIEKSRIISFHEQIRCFTSVILGEPQQASSRNPNHLLKSNRDKIFLESHDPIFYYFASFLIYKFRCISSKLGHEQIKGRYWICWIARLVIYENKELKSRLNSQKAVKECDEKVKLLSSDDEIEKVFAKSLSIFDAAWSEHKKANPRKYIKTLIRSDELKHLIQRLVKVQM